MYDELVKALRNDSGECGVLGKAKWGADFKRAADAIEELQKALEIVNDAHNEGYDVGYWAGRRDYEPKWIPVTERLPEKNQIVVVVQRGKTWDYGQFRGLAYLGGNVHKWNWKNNTIKTVDYWMPKKSAMPKPPKEET